MLLESPLKTILYVKSAKGYRHGHELFRTAEEVRQLLAMLGVEKLTDLIGRLDLLKQVEGMTAKQSKLDLGYSLNRVLRIIIQSLGPLQHTI